MSTGKYPTRKDSGLTIIEVIVTIAITALFVAGFFQTYFLLESHRLNSVRQAKASDIALINLAKFPNRPSDVVLGTCTTSPDGKKLTAGYTPETIIPPLNASTTQQAITVVAINGCTGTAFTDGPVKIISTVIYDGNGKVTHASIVN